jgi:predicted metal-dependent hydrolase
MSTRSRAPVPSRGDRRSATAGAHTLCSAVQEIPYTVRRSTRATRVLVNVRGETGVEVVLPARAPERAAAKAVAELRPWIARRLDEAQRARARRPFGDGIAPYLDERLQLVAQEGRRGARRAGSSLLVPAGDPRPALERFYRRRARAEIAARLDRASALAGTRYRDLAIRSQRTRWASCSPAGSMSFNWRLLLAPARVLDYVVWHEVCHLEVADHSQRFWSLVESRWPTWRSERDWLRRNGAALMLA